MAEVAVLLMLQCQLLVHHRADRRGQAIEEEGRRVGLVQLDREGALVDHLDAVVDVVGCEAELGQDEGGRLVQLDHAGERPGGILGGERMAAVEGDAVAHLERVGLAVVGDLPALGDVAAQVLDIVRRVGHQAIVDVGGVLGAGELEHLGRIERDQVVDLKRHDQAVLRRLGSRCRDAEHHGKAAASAGPVDLSIW